MAIHASDRTTSLRVLSTVFAAVLAASVGPAAAAPPAVSPTDPAPAAGGAAGPPHTFDPVASPTTPPISLPTWNADGDATGPGGLAEAVDRARAAADAQAAGLGLRQGQTVPLTGYEEPSTALLELADRHDTELTSEQRQQVQALDDLPEPTAVSLAQLVDAFLALDEAARTTGDGFQQDTVADAISPWVQEAREIEHPTHPTPTLNDHIPPTAVTGGALDLPVVLETRAQLLEVIVDLAEVSTQSASSSGCEVLAVPPAFSVAKGTCENTYASNVALSVDLGGADTYLNNAGGSQLEVPGPDCYPVDLDPTDQGVGAAALVDLGSEDDVYRPQVDAGCGTNGGGHGGGVGFLLDAGGDDTYEADRPKGANGGGDTGGSGFLLDAGGNDTYEARSFGTNGGGHLGSSGFLYDAGGHDTYNAVKEGTNGGGWDGIGALVDDGAGNDAYSATVNSANGGGSLGVGLLVDRGGDDTYEADNVATNGGAFLGAGALIDRGGDDTYEAGDVGTNGGAWIVAGGLLLDESGNDIYRAGSAGTNGGAALGGNGALVDRGGDDTYQAGGIGANGGAALGGDGLLLDTRGTDGYHDDIVDCRDCTVVPKGDTPVADCADYRAVLDRDEVPIESDDVPVDCEEFYSMVPTGPLGAQIDRSEGTVPG